MSHCGYTDNCVCTTGFCLGILISSLVLSFGLRLVQLLARGVALCLLMASSNPELDPVQTREVAPTTADIWLQLRSPRKSTFSDQHGSGLGWSLSVPCPSNSDLDGWLFLMDTRPKAQWSPCVLFTPIWLRNIWNPSETTLGGHLTWLSQRWWRSRILLNTKILPNNNFQFKNGTKLLTYFSVVLKNIV